MDIQNLLGMLLSSDSVKGLSKASGSSAKDVRKVLSEALPVLLGGADQQAKGDTAESFTKALADHAKDDTSNLTDFLKNIDLADGAKIIGHLLGSDQESTTKGLAEKTGVSESKIGDILSSVAPLLMSLLGQQADSDSGKDSGIGDLMGALLENVDVGELLTTLLTDSSASKKSKKSSGKTSIGTVIGKVLKSFLK